MRAIADVRRRKKPLIYTTEPAVEGRCIVTVESEPIHGALYVQRSIDTAIILHVALRIITDCIREGIGGFATLELRNTIRNFFAPYGRDGKSLHFHRAQHNPPLSGANESRLYG